MSTTTESIACNCWHEDVLGVDTLFIQSPSGRKIAICLESDKADALGAEGAAAWSLVQDFALAAIKEREAYEKREHRRLRKLADERGKQWVYDLPEYQEHIKALRFMYPCFGGTVSLLLSKEQMSLLLTLSKL